MTQQTKIGCNFCFVTSSTQTCLSLVHARAKRSLACYVNRAHWNSKKEPKNVWCIGQGSFFCVYHWLCPLCTLLEDNQLDTVIIASCHIQIWSSMVFAWQPPQVIVSVGEVNCRWWPSISNCCDFLSRARTYACARKRALDCNKRSQGVHELLHAPDRSCFSDFARRIQDITAYFLHNQSSNAELWDSLLQRLESSYAATCFVWVGSYGLPRFLPGDKSASQRLPWRASGGQWCCFWSRRCCNIAIKRTLKWSQGLEVFYICVIDNQAKSCWGYFLSLYTKMLWKPNWFCAFLAYRAHGQMVFLSKMLWPVCIPKSVGWTKPSLKVMCAIWLSKITAYISFTLHLWEQCSNECYAASEGETSRMRGEPRLAILFPIPHSHETRGEAER